MTCSPEIRRALRIIIIGQCAGTIGPLLFGNGFMLAYFLRIGIPAYRVVFLFALMPLIIMALTLPFARLSDRYGKKKLGTAGLAVAVTGFLMLAPAAFIPGNRTAWLTAAILTFAVGNAANGASWFALLSPIVPEEIRGRWFGRMRISWQTTSILFSLGLAVLLRHRPELYIFQIVLLVTGLLMIVRLRLYMQIPELDPVVSPRDGFFRTLGSILKIPGYARFCIYVFLLALTSGGAGLFGLLQKEVLRFNDSQLIMMGNLMAIGTVAGFFTGGKTVDRFGTKPVFFCGNTLLALILGGLLLRGFSPLPLTVTMGLLCFACGAVQGATGIAGTSALLALVPQENKSLSTGFNIAMSSAGLTLAGLLNGQLLKTGVLPEQWTLLGNTLSSYDALLSGFMILALLMASALGLVPTIRHIRSQWMPQNR